jgi:hypothetical protein
VVMGRAVVMGRSAVQQSFMMDGDRRGGDGEGASGRGDAMPGVW